MRLSNELQIGKAGEYLVCADLIIKGFVAFPSEQGLPYDVLLDNGRKLIRIQVKTCEKPRILLQRRSETLVYQYNIKRHGKNNTKRYSDDEVDIFALVALDQRTVGYLNCSDTRETLNFRVDKLRGTYYDEKGVHDYENVMSLRQDNPSMTQTAIAKELGLQMSVVNRMFRPGFKPFISEARYLSDIEKTSEWFLSL